ncbi:MAG: flagellar hook-associated protein FlgK [Treponema sp.]|jgi:flagellar hook-associated protein 1 FlgK|nr:flagellar hook-associated protein FlgK [Treponema sp.]
MTSTFSGIQIGKRGVMAHQTALNTTGHNLTNVNTPGFSRQRVEFGTFDPIFLPGLTRAETAGQIGQGVIANNITRLRDELLDRRIVAQAGAEGYWQTRDRYIRDLERIYNEPGFNSIRSNMDMFWDSWQELGRHPADAVPRHAVLERGRTLIDSIHQRYHTLSDLQARTDQEIRMTVFQINDLSTRIAELNETITRIRAQGDNPNDLFDRRDLLVDELASKINIAVDRRDPDEFMLHTSGFILVQGRIGRQIDIVPNNEGFSNMVWNDTRSPLELREDGRNGSLGALVNLRDYTLRNEIQSLNNMTMNFVGLVNEVHTNAYGINGVTGLEFFVEHPFVTNINGNYDMDGDGVYDSSFIFRVSGSNTLEPRAHVGLSGVITLSGAQTNISIPYFPTDTVADVINRINNSGAEVTARLNREGQLTLTATPSANPDFPDFVIRHIEDSGRFLEGYAGLLSASGPDGAFSWNVADAVDSLVGGPTTWQVAPIAHPSGWIEVNPALFRDPQAVAAGFGENGRPASPGNGDAAMAIAGIRNTEVMVGQYRTFDDFFSFSVGRIGLLGEQSMVALETQNNVMRQLQQMRQSISGVNMDEELSNMIMFQHGYAASARFITVVDMMLDVIINRMGA